MSASVYIYMFIKLYLQVDIFLRRAFFSPLGKIHCLAYADLLRYEIEEKIEKKFIDYIEKANGKLLF